MLRRRRFFALAFVLFACRESSTEVPVGPYRSGPGEALTQRFDNGRTGANLAERVLRPSNVGSLALSRSFPVDEQVYAQPLVVEGVEGKTLLLVATMANTFSAYDFDAPVAGPPLWQVGPSVLGTPGDSPRNVGGKNGILSTPVVDKARGVAYVVSRDCDPLAPKSAPSCAFHLTAVRLADGATAASVVVAGSVKNGAGQEVAFDASLHWNRPALLLAGDRLFVAFGSGPPEDRHEEDFVYHGWVFGYAAAALSSQPPSIYCTTPDARGGSIWQGGGGLAADDEHVYFAGANGILGFATFPPPSWPSAPRGGEDSIGKLSIADASKLAGRYWDDRPYLADGNVFQYMESGDNGFGSASPTLVPGARDLIVTGKSGMIYLVDRDTMSSRQTPLIPFSNLPFQPGHTMHLHSWWGIPFCSSVVFYRLRGGAAGLAFAWAADDRLKSFRYDYAARSLVVEATADVAPIGKGSSGGGLLALSADRDDDESAVLWAVSRSATDSKEGRLWAFAPRTLAELWHVDTPSFQKFAPPVVVRGHVLVAATGNGAAERAILDYAIPSGVR